MQGCGAGASSVGAGGDLRRRLAHRGSADRHRDAADRAGWVVRFNAAGPEGLVDRKPPGSLPRLTDAHRAALAATIEAGPIPASHGVVRWRLIDLGQWLWEEFRVSVSKQTLSRELRAMGYRKLSARPRHYAQAAGAIEDFKKTSPRAWMKSRAKRQSTSKP